MNILTYACAIFFLLTARPIYAQKVLQDEFDHEAFISDLNVIARPLSKDTLSNGDVAIIFGATCSTMRVVRRDRIDQRVEALINETYPSKKDIAALDREKFVQFEKEQLAKYGASDEAVQFVLRALEEHPSLPPTAPSFDVSLTEQTATLEKVSCALREEVVEELGAPAPIDKVTLAKRLGLAVVGTVLIVVDAKASISTGGAAGTVIGGVSIGWGWNRIEDAYSYVKKIWNSLF